MKKQTVSVDLSKVDWKALQTQKAELLEMRRDLECRPDNAIRRAQVRTLSGIIHLIDDIQDQAAEQIGTDKVF